ncbi:hypothetical protein HZA42_04580 [Candidatus Peregrinibacteria bacterium]|nr:hypothetical protein [Candidatus Peregrinibacteria bacterium]
MITHSLLGIICGIVAGFLFALLIAFIANKVGVYTDPRDFTNYSRSSVMPYDVVSLLGMGFGAVVGAIMGGVSANRK